MKDRIGNKLATGDRVLVSLPESAIMGFVAEVKETGLVARVRGGGAGHGSRSRSGLVCDRVAC